MQDMAQNISFSDTIDCEATQLQADAYYPNCLLGKDIAINVTQTFLTTSCEFHRTILFSRHMECKQCRAMILGRFIDYFFKKCAKENLSDLLMHDMNSGIDSIYSTVQMQRLTR